MNQSPYLLIADDDKDDQYILESAFREKGFTEVVQCVHDGQELMAHLLSIPKQTGALPTLLVLDLNMPKKNGKEALDEIKQHPQLKTVPVVIFSTTSDSKEIKDCYRLGANSYVVKPSSYADLLSVVDTIHQYWFYTVATV
jgi:CheY-like chemotaxis protein